MKYITVLFMVLVFACGQKKAAQEKVSDPSVPVPPPTGITPVRDSIPSAAIYDEYLPPALIRYIRQSMPDWKLPAPNLWEKFWFDDYQTGKFLVNFISADFNCDGATDHALILLNQKNDIGAWAFLAKDSSFEKTKLDEFENWTDGRIDCGLLVLERGEQHHISADDETAKTVKVNCEGVTVIFFEKAARSYYWEKGKVKAIQTGD
jgi:hypothetical protein